MFVRGQLIACVGTTGGRFGTGAVTDASGQQTHRLTIHTTPFVTHLHVFDMDGACCQPFTRSAQHLALGALRGRGAGPLTATAGRLHWKATRASLPPSRLWFFEPRAETHDVGG